MLGQRPGEQTFGFLYGIDASRTNIALDPRLVLDAVLAGQPVPTTSSDTWALYYNAAQFIAGDADDGWGAFLRLGLSDGDPNPVRWTVAVGAGGTGLLPGRDDDRWGLGLFYLGMSDADLLDGLGVDDELGAELFYNLALTPWLGVTLDAQVVEGAIPGSETAWILGMRSTVTF
jgi:porin